MARVAYVDARLDEHVPPPLDRVTPDWDVKSKLAAGFDVSYLFKEHDKVVATKNQTNHHAAAIIDSPAMTTASKKAPATPPKPTITPQTKTTFGLPSLPLSKIKNKEGHVRDTSGNYTKRSCYICRGWYERPPTTSFQCKSCGMPLCNPLKTGVREGRSDSCLFEHKNSTHEETKCGGLYYRNKKFLPELKHYPLMKLKCNIIKKGSALI
jgi:hypothetical protein